MNNQPINPADEGLGGVGLPAPTVFVNGEAVTTVPVADRGFQYGDGLFETVAVANGGLEFWDRHMARLIEGCARLALPAPDIEALVNEVEVLLNGQRLIEGIDSGVLKVMVTRGTGGRGYRMPDPIQATRIVSFHPAPDYPAAFARDGIRVTVCETRLASQPRLAGIKHLNRLENVLARAEWDDPAIVEGLMCDEAGRVVEGVMTNLFCVTDGVLRTPDLSRCGVAGIIRDLVMEIAEEKGIACRQGDIPLKDALASDDLFLTNSVIGLWPIRAVADQSFAIGPITTKIRLALIDRRRAETKA